MVEALGSYPPGLLMIIGAMLLPLMRKLFGPSAPAIGALAISTSSLVLLCLLPHGVHGTLNIVGTSIDLVRIDRFSFLFALVFHLAAIMAAIFALHVRDLKQHVAGLAYAGAAIAASCAGDLMSLFVYWELTALTSVVLIWASNTETSWKSGLRYLIIQVMSGVLLLSGSIMHFNDTGSLAFGALGQFGVFSIETLAGQLILASFAIKAAFPLLHNWLQDSYPQATATGTVYLSAFTTKLAIYSLARGFAGTEELIWVGCAMTLFPIIFAVIENDLRRVLAYSLNNQLGFMVVGIGIGTELSLNGTAAHAFCHIIYKALLFMSMGAVLHRVGTTKASELGGLYKSMPWTTMFCIIGAGSIAGFPLLSGFISKSMIITAAAEEHHFIVWVILLIASAGVMEHSGIKIPFFAFFAHDSGKRVKEAPLNMLIAMGLASLACITLGIAFPLLYQLLPFESHYSPYTTAHVVTQFQLLLFAALAFVVLMKSGLYPEEIRSTNLDFDWTYRKAAPWVIGLLATSIGFIDRALRSAVTASLSSLNSTIARRFDPRGTFGRPWQTSTMAALATLLLGLCLLLYYL